MGLDQQAFLLINAPLVSLNLTANIFFACCLVFPLYGGRTLKQPLKILLELLVCYSIVYSVFFPLLYVLFEKVKHIKVILVLWGIFLHNLQNSMATFVWLNFYYFIQIVPSQRALLIWVKRNIRPVIYMALLFDGNLFLVSGSVVVANDVFQTAHKLGENNLTGTEYGIESLFFESQDRFLIVRVHALIHLCIMMTSSFSTVHFLYSHIRSVAQNGNLLSSSRIKSQVRVTITGIFQGVLFLFYSIFLFFGRSLSQPSVLSVWVFVTVTSLYVSGTTINLGIGQTAFRRRAADVCKLLKAW